jgi:excisionase family DNA binding protein
MDERDEEFEELIERSSLGASGARRLRQRTPYPQVEAVRRIVDLRNQMAHSGVSESTQAATALVQLLRDLGYEGQAQRILAEEFPGREAESVVGTAQIINESLGRRQGEHVDSAAEPDLTAEKPTSATPERLLTPGEVAALFRVDTKTVIRWASAGRIGSIRTPGGHRRFRESEVHALLASLTTPAPLDRASTQVPKPDLRPGMAG